MNLGDHLLSMINDGFKVCLEPDYCGIRLMASKVIDDQMYGYSVIVSSECLNDQMDHVFDMLRHGFKKGVSEFKNKNLYKWDITGG